jgi:large subunit ribosomal protein L22
MEEKVSATLRYLRIAPRKVRLVADLIKRKKVSEAKEILFFTKKRAARAILKLLNSAVSNAKNKFGWKEEELKILNILVNEGPRLKRILPRGRGGRDIIQKKMSHVKIFLEKIKS